MRISVERIVEAMKRIFFLPVFFALLFLSATTRAQSVTQDYLYTNSTTGQDSVKGFRLYPNPNDGEMMLEVYRNIPGPIRLDIYDGFGKLVDTRQLSEFNADGTMYINLKGVVTAGHYIFIFNYNDQFIQTEKVFITRTE
jgi:hypothetical protein